VSGAGVSFIQKDGVLGGEYANTIGRTTRLTPWRPRSWAASEKATGRHRVPWRPIETRCHWNAALDEQPASRTRVAAASDRGRRIANR
jgi:hypothetical protein